MNANDQETLIQSAKSLGAIKERIRIIDAIYEYREQFGKNELNVIGITNAIISIINSKQ